MPSPGLRKKIVLNPVGQSLAKSNGGFLPTIDPNILTRNKCLAPAKIKQVPSSITANIGPEHSRASLLSNLGRLMSKNINLPTKSSIAEEDDDSVLPTETCKSSEPEVLPYELYDFVYPLGGMAKYAKILSMMDFVDDLYLLKILRKFDYEMPRPVIIFSGAKLPDKDTGLLLGIATAAVKSDAIIISSGVKTGVERFCKVKGVNLIGVYPESQVVMPKVSPSVIPDNVLADGHSQIFSIADQLYVKWGNECKFKLRVAQKYIIFFYWEKIIVCPKDPRSGGKMGTRRVN